VFVDAAAAHGRVATDWFVRKGVGVHSQPPNDPPLDLEDLVVAAIRRLIRAVDLHSRRLAEHHGLTGPQLATLREVARGAQIAASTLARGVHLSAATMTGILSRLERQGLVQRVRGTADRRNVMVSITDLGRRRLEQSPSLLQDRFRRQLSTLQPWERLMMLANLQRIAAMMDAEGLDAAPHLVSGVGLLDQPEPADRLPVSPMPLNTDR
jgi:DNA-binding MarR family transcriptional regulator